MAVRLFTQRAKRVIAIVVALAFTGLSTAGSLFHKGCLIPVLQSTSADNAGRQDVARTLQPLHEICEGVAKSQDLSNHVRGCLVCEWQSNGVSAALPMYTTHFDSQGPQEPVSSARVSAQSSPNLYSSRAPPVA